MSWSQDIFGPDSTFLRFSVLQFHFVTIFMSISAGRYVVVDVSERGLSQGMAFLGSGKNYLLIYTYVLRADPASSC